MSLGGLKLAALYSYKCRRARRLKINRLLLEFIRKETNREEVQKNLEKLNSYAWYRIIAFHYAIDDPFDERVIRAYWTGNELTKPIEKEGVLLFPFHNFTVLQNLSHCAVDIDAVNNCKISGGRVEEIKGQILYVCHRPILQKENKFFVGERLEKIEKGFIDKVKKGNWITFHYSIGREVLSHEQMSLLERLTEDAIKLFNETQPSSR